MQLTFPSRMFRMLLVLILLSYGASAGLLAYGVCQTNCNMAYSTCVVAAGGIVGVSTAGVGAGPAILACNAGLGLCMATLCAPALLLPTPRWHSVKLGMKSTFLVMAFMFGP